MGAESHNIYAKKIKLFYKTPILDVSPLSRRIFDAIHANVDAQQTTKECERIFKGEMGLHLTTRAPGCTDCMLCLQGGKARCMTLTTDNTKQ